eukprot:3537392-Ditylum_brightwellii.AAC.1
MDMAPSPKHTAPRKEDSIGKECTSIPQTTRDALDKEEFKKETNEVLKSLDCLDGTAEHGPTYKEFEGDE